MNPEDERAAFWQAVHAVDDRVTALEATVSTRHEMMRESIHSAVREAMPLRLPTEKQMQYIDMAIEREAERAAFRKKVIESSAIWAIPLMIIAVLAVFREYAIAHGMWRP